MASNRGDENVSGSSSGDVTLASYEMNVDRYVRQSARPGGPILAYLDQFTELLGAGTVLELGSGPGWDAEHLERCGLRVVRTDGASSFVARLRGAGQDARILDIRTDSFDGPYDAILADAVLLHLSRDQFVAVLRRAREAVRDGGLFGFTVKEGEGQSWSRAKLDSPRLFTFWREKAVRAALDACSWRVLRLEHIAGRSEPWIFVIATTRECPPA